MKKILVRVNSTGRCGTKFLSKYFSFCGLNTFHENFLGKYHYHLFNSSVETYNFFQAQLAEIWANNRDSDPKGKSIRNSDLRDSNKFYFTGNELKIIQETIHDTALSLGLDLELELDNYCNFHKNRN